MLRTNQRSLGKLQRLARQFKQIVGSSAAGRAEALGADPTPGSPEKAGKAITDRPLVANFTFPKNKHTPTLDFEREASLGVAGDIARKFGEPVVGL